jgi:uncharacterized protein
MNCTPRLIFKTEEIRAAEGLSLSFTLPAQDLKIESAEREKLSEPLTVGLDFSVGGKHILLEAHMAGHWTLACSRCLTPHKAAFEATLDETYPASEDSIDIGDDLRQAVLIEFPQMSACREDCKGLCDQCGKNKNDSDCGCVNRPPSPFDVLKKLK